MKQIIITFLAVLFTATLFAQAPQAFNYQGVARDLSGNPIPNQPIGFRVAILNSSTGMEVYKETHNPIMTNSLGLFNLQIGKGTTNGFFKDINWRSGNHFLQIEMDESGGSNYQIIGTSQLLSVPYALYAESGNDWNKLSNDQGIYSFGSFDNIGRVNMGTNNLGPFPIRVGVKGIEIKGGDPRYIGFSSLMGFYDNNDKLVWNYALNLNNDLQITPTGVSDGALTVGRNGFVGIPRVGDNPEFTPLSSLHVESGDIYLEDATKGVIMKSPDGQCWRMTVSIVGQPIFTSINCPN